MRNDPPVHRVSDAELRRIYRDAGIEALIDSGDLTSRILADRSAPSRAGQPNGTRSQLLAYLNAHGDVIVRVYQYLRPDGTIGASGKPDPKYILYEGQVYKQEEKA